jgi:hypothetical protein
MLIACPLAATAGSTLQNSDGNITVSNNQSLNNSANQTGIPDSRIRWMKNPLITRISFVDATVRENSTKLRYNISTENPTSAEVRGTGKPMPEENPIRLFSDGNRIDLSRPRNPSEITGSQAPPRG